MVGHICCKGGSLAGAELDNPAPLWNRWKDCRVNALSISHPSQTFLPSANPIPAPEPRPAPRSQQTSKHNLRSYPRRGRTAPSPACSPPSSAWRGAWRCRTDRCRCAGWCGPPACSGSPPPGAGGRAAGTQSPGPPASSTPLSSAAPHISASRLVRRTSLVCSPMRIPLSGTPRYTDKEVVGQQEHKVQALPLLPLFCLKQLLIHRLKAHSGWYNVLLRFALLRLFPSLALPFTLKRWW